MSKTVLVMDMPKCCEECIFNVCKYSLPLTTKRKGYYCQLDEDRKIFDMDYDNKNFLSPRCPLRPLPKRRPENVPHNVVLKDWYRGFNACLDTITGGAENE